MSQNNTKTALITGASSGIGEAFAHILAQDGYHLVLVARSREKLNLMAKDLESKYTIAVEVLIEDLAQPHSATKIYKAIKTKQIVIDTLINNAGFGDYGSFVDEDIKLLNEMIHLNITSLTEMTWLFAKDMKARNEGSILNIASTAAFQPLPKLAVYAATKAYVLHFTEAIHHELKGYKVNISALCPGPTNTGFAQRAKADNLFFFKNGMNAHTVAQIGYRALRKNKMTIISGFKNKLSALSRMMPSRSLLVKIAGKII